MTRWLGILLVGVAIVGYLTVADDLRHRDEFVGVSAVLGIGLTLLAVSRFRRRKE